MIRFKEAAEQIRKKGGPKKLTVRQLLALFGQQRRGRHVTAQVRRALRKEKLETIPSFEVVHMDTPILLQPKTAAAVKEEKKAEAAGEGVSITTEEREVVLTIGQLEKANKPPFRVARQDTVTKAITLMMQHDTAHLAVMSGDRTVDGILTWQTIGKASAAKRSANTVDQYMSSVRIVEIDTPLFDAVREIVQAEAVLVRAKDRTICGLVSSQDITNQFVTLSEPFLFLEQIENHLRAILEKARLPAAGVKELVNPSDSDRMEKVNCIDDLSFGETARAFGREDIWHKLHLLLDRSVFCARLEEIRSIRNKVMHFHPDGISTEDREVLRKTRQMLQTL
ncbi:MAG: CBS domain-containing protein [Acidobacteriota bacterium]|nr:CBS domain-containing protein [Acidobacteriota bacterium]